MILQARTNDFQFVQAKNVSILKAAALRVLAADEGLYVATDATDRRLFDPIRKAGHRVLTFADALHAGTCARKNQTTLPRSFAGDANHVSMTIAEARALDAVGRNLYGMVDVLVAAQGRTFTATWFSTLSTHVQRIRGYVGRPDQSTFFSMESRWAACQRWEAPRRPWYMREFPTAWRNIDGDEEPAPRPGEGVYNIARDGVDYQQKGYPSALARDGRRGVDDPRVRPFAIER